MNNPKLQTFIFIHDQDILIDFIRVNKFAEIKNLKYVFLGSGDVSKIENLFNVIISRNLPINIEEYPKLTSFTGWYSIWKNKLYDSDYINLFEYDINLNQDFNDIVKSIIGSNLDIIGYIPLSVHHHNFIKHKPWCTELLNSIEKNYKINTELFVDFLPNDQICSVTSNHTFSIQSFESYMSWVEPMVSDIKDLKLSGHQIERSISLFYLLNNKKYKVLPNILTHFQFDSHQTQNIGQDKFNMNYKHLLK